MELQFRSRFKVKNAFQGAWLILLSHNCKWRSLSNFFLLIKLWNMMDGIVWKINVYYKRGDRYQHCFLMDFRKISFCILQWKSTNIHCCYYPKTNYLWRLWKIYRTETTCSQSVYECAICLRLRRFYSR